MEHSNSSKFSAAALRVDERRSMAVAVVSHLCTAGSELFLPERVGVALACDRCDRNVSQKPCLVAGLRACGCTKLVLLSLFLLLSSLCCIWSDCATPTARKAIDCWQQ